MSLAMSRDRVKEEASAMEAEHREPSESTQHLQVVEQEEDPLWDPSYDLFGADSLEALEWSHVTEFLSTLCRTVWGKAYAKRLPFFATRTEAERELEQVGDALRLMMEQGESLPAGGMPDLRPAFVRLEKGASLDASEFMGVVDLLNAAAKTRGFVAEYETFLASLWERAELLRPLTRLRRSIEGAFDRGGRLRDDASWELGALREEARRCHDRIRRKMQDYLSSHSKQLTDTYYTLRQDRYVLPVKAQERSKVSGIVYGSSGSGATVFIEPQPMVAMNNDLRIAEEAVVQEELRILRKLSAETAQELPVLRANLELLRDFDILQARVRLAEQLDATVPILVPVDQNASLDLKKARHPLLLLKGVDVVANDMALGAKGRTLLISGPNTGGKTIALKTMGICALMARAGLPIPTDQGSVIPFFDAIFTDIGDHQSIEFDLSTFSGQIVKLREIMEQAHDCSLVLIDEIVVGTDPYQGAALATSILEKLTEQNCFVAATTHYEQLKALAYEDDRFVNASVGFDLEDLAPTYRLYIGTPGSSSALDIARRLGLDEALCGRAEQLLSPAGDRFDRIIGKLEQQYQELYEERERATRARRKLEREVMEQQRKSEQIDSMHERLRSGEEQNWRQQFRKARELLRDAVNTLQRDPGDWSQVQAAQRQLKEAESLAGEARVRSQPKSVEQPPTEEQLKPGQKVKILSLRAEGEVVEGPDANGQVLIQAGMLRTRVSRNDVRSLSNRQSKQRSKRRSSSTTQPKHSSSTTQPKRPSASPRKQASSSVVSDESTHDFSVIPSSENNCDLRGMRVEQALDAVEAFLDKAMRQERLAVLLIHGHGTGVLRSVVRDYCRQSPYIERFRPGDKSEGGNGVTAVLLK